MNVIFTAYSAWNWTAKKNNNKLIWNIKNNLEYLNGYQPHSPESNWQHVEPLGPIKIIIKYYTQS